MWLVPTLRRASSSRQPPARPPRIGRLLLRLTASALDATRTSARIHATRLSRRWAIECHARCRPTAPRGPTRARAGDARELGVDQRRPPTLIPLSAVAAHEVPADVACEQPPPCLADRPRRPACVAADERQRDARRHPGTHSRSSSDTTATGGREREERTAPGWLGRWEEATQVARPIARARPLASHRPRSSSATEPSTKAAPTNAPAQSGSSSTVAPITAPTSGVT
jgi:hypothetical protein